MKLTKLACIALCGLMLAGCEIIVDGTPGPRPYRPEPELEVIEAVYATNYRDADGRSLICDDRSVALTYRFRYRGELDAWHSYLEGQRTGDVKGAVTFYPDSEGVSEVPSGYEVTYMIPPLVAPLKKERALHPRAIDVVPVPQPTIIGASKLYLTLVGEGPDANFVSKDIPIIDNCPE